MTIKKIHHINFLVKDLIKGIARYEQLFNVKGFIIESLPQRGVDTARVLLGEQWLVLIQPIDPESIPGRHLALHGEGFFLISFSVDNLKDAAQTIISQGGGMTSPAPRQGLEDWIVWDVNSDDTFGVQVQLCQTNDSSQVSSI